MLDGLVYGSVNLSSRYYVICFDFCNNLSMFDFRPDPAHFIEGMRILTERKASGEDIEAYVSEVKQYEVILLSKYYFQTNN